MKSTFEMVMMLIVTGSTNIFMAPAIYSLFYRKYVFEVRYNTEPTCHAPRLEQAAFIGTFTMITSFMYHVCDSIDGPLWLTEGQWHRLDNIGSIMSFIMWSIHLMDLNHAILERYLQYFFLALVMIFQEKNPWDELNSAIPVLCSLVLLLLSFALRRRMPKYNLQQFRRGLLLLLCGLGCFLRGLDDNSDPFRFFHGCWHGFVGAAAYYNFKVLPDRDDMQLPTKRQDYISHFDQSYAPLKTRMSSHLAVKGGQTKPIYEQPQGMSVVDRIYAYDLTWSTKLYHQFCRDPTSRLCWEIFSHSGDGFLWILTIPPIMGLFWVAGLIGPFEPGTKMLLSTLFTVMTVDIIAIMLLKQIFHRKRPPFHQIDIRFVGPDQHSFPSGHSTRVWAMVAMIIYLAETHPDVLRRFFYGVSPVVLIVLTVIWALIINFSRVALGRHYPTDVIAGTLIGVFVFWPISLFFVNYFDMLKES
ncbi:hypothetical protein PsorP6_005068 [Peronosclerospora sorghi]|uniref:Uncharacterized protein n=1 Tax=Peronosclerospora sorghi TaxID=230839 RepID=A0ACC0W215_9STRA|nr:hypothetical protein PsorP6_005068 [Peronosclerospora sorghi]